MPMRPVKKPIFTHFPASLLAPWLRRIALFQQGSYFADVDNAYDTERQTAEYRYQDRLDQPGAGRYFHRGRFRPHGYCCFLQEREVACRTENSIHPLLRPVSTRHALLPNLRLRGNGHLFQLFEAERPFGLSVD